MLGPWQHRPAGARRSQDQARPSPGKRILAPDVCLPGVCLQTQCTMSKDTASSYLVQADIGNMRAGQGHEATDSQSWQDLYF